jgi:imidazolonepropionase-like amidohydrolase
MNRWMQALLLVSLPIGVWGQDKAAEQEKFAIQGVTVVNAGGSSIATVSVEGGRIVAVDAGESEPVGFKIVKGQGKFLYPGFIDAHIARGVKAPPAAPETGKPNQSIMAPASLWIGNRKGITPEWNAGENLDFTPEKSYYEAGITTGNMIPSAGALRGTGACIQLLPASVNDRVLTKTTHASMTFRIGSGTGYPSNVLGNIALMRQVLWDAKSFAEGAELYPSGEKEPFWMASLKALQPVMKRERTVLFEANIDREIERAFRLKDEFGFDLAIAGGRDAYKHVELLKSSKTPVVMSADMGFEPSLTANNKDDLTPQEVRQERHDKWKAQIEGTKMLVDAGVALAFTAGTSTNDFIKNLRLLVKNGLSTKQVLDAVTMTPANLLGVSSSLGSVEKGKLANLVLVSGDLFIEGSKIERVWVDGRPVLGAEEVKK